MSARLDYCNAVLYGTSQINVSKLQRLQNALARSVVGIRKFEHISPILAGLHWLPVAARIEFKVALLTFKVLTTQQPGYLHDLLQLHRPSRQLRSSDHNELVVPRAKTVFAQRSFACAAPAVWNKLPYSITDNYNSVSLTSFKTALKTVLYRRHFS